MQINNTVVPPYRRGPDPIVSGVLHFYDAHAVNAFAGIPSIQNCPTILLAEDNEDHVLFIKRAFIHARLLNPVKVVRDGREAVAYLKGEGKFADRKEYPGPALLLLDLKMPNMDGFEVMEWIRTQPTLARLRIVVLTTSDQIFDVNRAYALGAISFLTKPLDMRDFIQLGPVIKGCWTWTTDDEDENSQSRQPVTTRRNGPLGL